MNALRTLRKRSQRAHNRINFNTKTRVEVQLLSEEVTVKEKT